MVFNRKLGNGWSDLDDFFGRPPWNFDSDKMVKKSAIQHVCKRVRAKWHYLLRVSRILVDFGRFLPQSASVSAMENFSLWWETPETFKDQSSRLGYKNTPQIFSAYFQNAV